MQAILVCRDNQVDLTEVKRWSANEGKSDEYIKFKERLREETERN